ncbi:unnamed protein product [Victoria cruziana]
MLRYSEQRLSNQASLARRRPVADRFLERAVRSAPIQSFSSIIIFSACRTAVARDITACWFTCGNCNQISVIISVKQLVEELFKCVP